MLNIFNDSTVQEIGQSVLNKLIPILEMLKVFSEMYFFQTIHIEHTQGIQWKWQQHKFVLFIGQRKIRPLYVR